MARRVSIWLAFFAVLALVSPSQLGIGRADADERAGEANLSRAKRARAQRLRKARLRKAKLRKAKLRKAKLRKAKLRKAKLRKAKLRKAKLRKRRRARLRRRRRRSRKTRVCQQVARKTRSGKVRMRRRCSWQKWFQSSAVAKSSLRKTPAPKPSGEIHVSAVHFDEALKLNIYDKQGNIDDAALAKLDHNFRCKRTLEVRAVNPRLLETLSRIYDHFGKKRIELVSGFRFQHNQGSRHWHASAMDIRIPGVGLRDLYAFAASLDTGGMGIGIYPRSGFVHVDWRAPGAASLRWTDWSRPGSTSIRARRVSQR